MNSFDFVSAFITSSCNSAKDIDLHSSINSLCSFSQILLISAKNCKNSLLLMVSVNFRLLRTDIDSLIWPSLIDYWCCDFISLRYLVAFTKNALNFSTSSGTHSYTMAAWLSLILIISLIILIGTVGSRLSIILLSFERRAWQMKSPDLAWVF